MITIKVVSQSSGNPVKNSKVTLGFDGLFTGGTTDSQYTDSNGEAHFDTEPRKGTVYVDGRDKHNGHLSGRVVVYI